MIDELAGAILLWIVVEDLCRFRIRNILVLGLMALFMLSCAMEGAWAALVWHCAFAAVALFLMFVAFSRGLVGAGDAKLMAVACLWVGPAQSTVFSLILLVLTAFYIVGVKLGLLPIRRDHLVEKIPFGPSIASSCLATIVIVRLRL